MPVYEYTALNIKGKKISGVIDAESASAARQKLRASGRFPVSIDAIDKLSMGKTSKTFSAFRPLTRVKSSDVSMLTRQLATLLGAGFPLVSAIDTLLPQTRSHAFNKILAQIKDSIIEGNSFADTLSLYPGVFSALYVNMVRAGETSGTLEIVLDRLADITEKQQALSNRIKSALAYPVLMSFFGVIILFFLLAYIVPSITSIFTDMNRVLPAPTVLLIAISDFVQSYWWIIFIILIGAAIAVRNLKKTTKGRYLIDNAILFSPGIGPLVKKLAAARFARTLGSLIENGVAMLASLEIVKNIVGNVFISEAIDQAAKEVGKGEGLGIALAANKVFPNLATQMIQVGEQSGELETMLYKVADVFENEVETTVMRMTSLLEPVMIVTMGTIVALIVLAICLPIFEMNQLIK